MLTRTQEAAASHTRAVEEQLSMRDATISQLEGKVAAQGDYDELKRELR